MARMAIVRRSDGLIINVVEVDPDIGLPFQLPDEYELIDAPYGMGYEIGNNVDVAKPGKPVSVDLLRKASELATALWGVRPEVAETLKEELRLLLDEMSRRVEECRREFEKLILRVHGHASI
jgi:hypothetical protein